VLARRKIAGTEAGIPSRRRACLEAGLGSGPAGAPDALTELDPTPDLLRLRADATGYPRPQVTPHFRAQPGPSRSKARRRPETADFDRLTSACVNADRLCVGVPGNLVRCASAVAMGQWVSACAPRRVAFADDLLTVIMCGHHQVTRCRSGWAIEPARC